MWNHLDNRFFDENNQDLLLFVGDLGSGSRKNGLSIIRALARLRGPALVLPGNNDAEHLPYFSAELAHQVGKMELLQVMGASQRGGVAGCGYSSHVMSTQGGEVTLIAARPCSMGGTELSFVERLQRRHGIDSYEGSIQSLMRLVDESTTDDLLFLAHHGPYGLGGGPLDPWSRDFSIDSVDGVPPPLDWGDKDLEAAVSHAVRSKKRVLGVIAGHMHRKTSQSQRPLLVEKDDIPYVNVAVVPRIVVRDTVALHHHVRIDLDPRAQCPSLRLRVKEIWIEHSLEDGYF